MPRAIFFGRRKLCTIGTCFILWIFIGFFILLNSFDIKIERKSISSSLNKKTLNQSDFYRFLSQPDLRSLETTVERCIGPAYNQSCLFRNLYYAKGTFWALSLKTSNLTLPGVRLEALATVDSRPKHRIFDTYEELHRFVHQDIRAIILPGLTVHFNQLWHRNVGHALFDGLYPAFVALLRFAPRHFSQFRIFAGLNNGPCDICFSEDIFARFAGIGLLKSAVLDSTMPKHWFVFEEMIMGSGMMCQRCIQSNYQLAGGTSMDGSRLFRDRMYKQHGVHPPDIRRHHSAERRDPRVPLNAFVVSNKRFTTEDRNEIRQALDEINRYTAEHVNKTIDEIKNLPFPLIHATYFSYQNVTLEHNGTLFLTPSPMESRSAIYEVAENKFVSQLKLLKQMDIHITGPGTGQMYQTFLSDGSVNINLGGMNPYQKETTPIAYPSFLEQYVTSGTPYIKGLYYPINKRRDGIKRNEVVKLIQEAAKMIMDGFVIPVNPKENLAPDGKVFVDQCAQDHEFCQLVTIRKSGMFWCNNMWTEDLVHERRQWAEGGYIINGNNVTCSFNRTLLRSLRNKYGIEYRPGRE